MSPSTVLRPPRTASTRRGVGARPTREQDGAPPWVSGLVAGLQAVLLSVLVVVMPTLAAYVATSADPANADVGWTQAVAVGAAVWLSGHGGELVVGGFRVSLIPLGITALATFVAYASARRSADRSSAAWLSGTAGYLLGVLLIAVLAGTTGPGGAGYGAVGRMLIGSALVAGVGIGLGTGQLGPTGALAPRARAAWERVPVVARSGARAGLLALALIVAAAAGVSAWWAMSGRAAVGDVYAGLGIDVFGGLLLSLAQLALAPNLVLWALTWLAGPGFAVGSGTLYSPAEVVSAPLPALPLLGALPTAAASGGPLAWAPVSVVLAGAVAGWWLHGRLRGTRAWHSAAAAVTAAAGAGAASALLTVLAGGAAGPGRLAVVGGPALEVGGSVAVLVAVGALLVAVPADPIVRGALSAGARRLAARITDAVRRARSGTSARPGAPVATGQADDEVDEGLAREPQG